jgi:pyruvyltransferase
MPIYTSTLQYLLDLNANRKKIKNLYWYKKHKGHKWIFGQNFGDYLSTVIVSKVAEQKGLSISKLDGNRQFLALGSIMHFAKDNDVVWGTGINGKIGFEKLSFKTLDIRAVRGRKSYDVLKQMGLEVPEIFGDPAILLPFLFPHYKWDPQKGSITLLPNMNELKKIIKMNLKEITIVSPFLHWKKIIKTILSSELLITSSLHGMIIAECFNVPVILYQPTGGETLFKYEDYFTGTGRELPSVPSLDEALTSKEKIIRREPQFPIDQLLQSFPEDIYQ